MVRPRSANPRYAGFAGLHDLLRVQAHGNHGEAHSRVRATKGSLKAYTGRTLWLGFSMDFDDIIILAFVLSPDNSPCPCINCPNEAITEIAVNLVG